MLDMTTKTHRKILTIPELALAVQAERGSGRSIAHCHGVFDLVHPGHIRHLTAASREADVLVVSITSDAFVNKGPGRPVYQALLRAETLAALECVQYVVINEAASAVDVIKLISPDVYVKGSDYASSADDPTGMIVEETKAVEAGGGRVHFTDELVMSSSELLNAFFDVYRPETRRWLNEIKLAHSANDIAASLYRLRNLKVLVIGEAIIDEYVFCEGLGKSSKDPILAFRYGSTERYAGGSLAVANHTAGICDTVELVTVLGERESRKKFIESNLNSKVALRGLSQRGAPTIAKCRYVDTHTGNKLFELYRMDNSPLDRRTELRLIARLDEIIEDFDIVLVADYGHGMMTENVINLVTRKAKFLAVNTQANAGNRGFNTISKYSRADYVCLNGLEAQLETRTQRPDFRAAALEIAKRIDCSKMTVTLGRSGTLHYDTASGFYEAPALAMNVADRVGAGDAVLAATTPMVAAGMSWDLVGLIGNLAGAETVAQLGAKRTLDAVNLVRHVQSILK